MYIFFCDISIQSRFANLSVFFLNLGVKTHRFNFHERLNLFQQEIQRLFTLPRPFHPL